MTAWLVDTELITDTKEPGPSRNREHKGSMWTNPAEYLRSMEAMMNRLLDEHGFVEGGLSPTPRTYHLPGTCAESI